MSCIVLSVERLSLTLGEIEFKLIHLFKMDTAVFLSLKIGVLLVI
jgi:hypothetical protein